MKYEYILYHVSCIICVGQYTSPPLEFQLFAFADGPATADATCMMFMLSWAASKEGNLTTF